MSLPVSFAPLQGYTDDVYRRLHHHIFGGVARYYTPFLRMEGNDVRAKDLRDIDPAHNEGVPVIPQIIVKSMKEFEFLLQIVEERGYSEVDINMGCPFPMQAKHGRGSGLLPHLNVVEEMAKAISGHKEMKFSVKMRLGWENAEEWRPVLDIFNEIPLTQITLHPRLGKQQYKGEPDEEAFAAFYELCRHPLLYNGDLKSVADIERIAEKFPKLSGVMIGRGLLARPTLAQEYQNGEEMSWNERRRLLLRMHDELKTHYGKIVNSESQLHSKLRTFWEYMDTQLDKKVYKRIMKSGNLKNYLAAVDEV